MSDDATLLRQYAEEGSDTAFRALVEQHIQLVNATARRMVAGDAHLAEDVTQLVFTDLARKAATLPEGVLLGGWLYRHTCYTAAKVVRTESRRRTRERTAMEIQALNECSAGDAHWAQLAPVLDDALSQLGTEDRDAIVLRYLQQKDVRSIGAMLGTSENAAQKRLGRALEKLREVLTRRGVTVSAVLLSTALDVGATQAPVTPGLAASVSTAALSSAAATTPLTLTLLKTMTTTKLAIGAAVIIATAGAAAILTHSTGSSDSSASAAPVTATTPATKPTVAATSPAHVEAPKAAPAPAGGAAALTDSSNAGSGAGYQVSGTFSGATNNAGGGFNTGSAANVQGAMTLSPGSMAGSRMVTTMGASGMLNLGEPESVMVNDDGSTTKTYTGPNGQKVQVTESADGKSRSMRMTSTTGANANMGTATVVMGGNPGNGVTGTMHLAAPSGEPDTVTTNADGSTTKTYTGPNGQTITTVESPAGSAGGTGRTMMHISTVTVNANATTPTAP